MITLNDIVSYLKENIDCRNFYAGKSDFSKEELIGVYMAQAQPAGRGHYGDHVRVKRINVLIHWGRTSSLAEEKAYEVYELIDEKSPVISGKQTHIFPLYEAPVFIGTDDSGIIEYSVIADIYY